MIVVAGIGYVLGAKAGRQRYEQIQRAAQAVAASPVTHKAVEMGRHKVSQIISPEPAMKTLQHIDAETTVYSPNNDLD